MRFNLADDIYACKDIDPQKEFLMVAYSHDDREESYHIDFYFLVADPQSPAKLRLEKAFFTIDDRFGTLDTYASMLMHHVQTQEMDTSITPEVRSLITDYLK